MFGAVSPRWRVCQPLLLPLREIWRLFCTMRNAFVRSVEVRKNLTLIGLLRENSVPNQQLGGKKNASAVERPSRSSLTARVPWLYRKTWKSRNVTRYCSNWYFDEQRRHCLMPGVLPSHFLFPLPFINLPSVSRSSFSLYLPRAVGVRSDTTM